METKSIVKEQLLRKMIKNYENSVLSKQGSNRNIKIEIKNNDAIFKKYFGSDAYKYRRQIEFEINELLKLEFIAIKRDYNNELEKVSLNLEKTNEVYKYLKLDNPKLINDELLKSIDDYVGFDGVVGDLARYLKRRIKNHMSVKSICSNSKEYVYLNKVISYIEKQEEDITKRQFSVQYLGDSKAFEKIEGKVCRVIKQFAQEDFIDDTSLLEYFHIHRNPTYVYLKGNMVISINNQIIDLEKLNYEISLSSKAIEDLEIKEIRAKKVMTIENLTSFVVVNEPEYIKIYLAGFHNDIKKKLLRKISQSDKELSFYHFGDIDAGGFYILEDLIHKTGIKFIPFYMDIETLKKYQSKWIDLTSNDKIRLKKLIDSDYSDTVKYMIQNNCKLEQENVGLYDTVISVQDYNKKFIETEQRGRE